MHYPKIFSRRAMLIKSGQAAGIMALTVMGAHHVLAAEPLQATMPAAVPGNATLAGKDVDVLNTALSLEHQAVSAYQIGADSGLLQNLSLNMVLLFQGHHKAHRDALTALIQKLGGVPVVAQSTVEYGAALGTSSIKSQSGVMQMALKLELTAVNNYLGFVGSLADKEGAKLGARIAADDTMHWTALASMVGQPLPANGLTFGA